MNRKKLKEILAILSPDGTETDFKAFDEGVDKLKSGLKQKIQAKTLEDVNSQLSRFKKGLDFEPLLTAIKDIDKNFDNRIKAVAQALAEEVSRFDELSKSEREETGSKVAESSGTVESLKFELRTLRTQKDKEMSDVIEALKGIPSLRADNETTFSAIKARLDALEVPEAEEPDLISPIKQEIQAVRSDLITRINNHGGNMNRNIAIGGNTSVLSRYTDINLKAGSNVTLSYAYNDVTKYTDVTVAATGGGGGSVTGIIRSINNVAGNTAAGNTAGTDYVYLVGATANITLPTSVNNLNMYTVKNVGAGTVTILPTGAETIEGTANITMPVQFTSVDLISNNSGNWNIT